MGKGARQKKSPGSVPVIEKKGQHSGENPALSLHQETLVLGILVILGLFLRLFEIARKPLWLDEATTNSLTIQPDLMAVVTAASNDHHAPLHFVTIWVVKFVGSSEFLLRLPSAIAGTLTIIAIFFIAKELYDGRAGLIAVALLAVSPIHLHYSQEARMYGMAVLFVALAVWMFLRASRTGELSDWLFFGGACTLAFYTHFYTAFIIAALVAGYFILRFRDFLPKKTGACADMNSFPLPHDLRNFACGLALAALLVLPLLGSFFSQSGYFVSHTFNWGLPLWNIPPATFIAFSAYSELFAVFFVCLMLAGLAIIGMKKVEMAITLAVLLFVPILISMYLSSIIPFNVRYHLYLIVVFLSLVAVPLGWIAGKMDIPYGTVVVIGIILLLSAIPVYAYYTDPIQEDWRTFSKNLMQETRAGDIIAPLPSYMSLPLAYYYDNASDATVYRSFPLNESGFRSLENTSESVYYVVTWDIVAADPSGYSLGYLSNRTLQMPGSVDGILLLKKIS